jgi:hypothetical protein
MREYQVDKNILFKLKTKGLGNDFSLQEKNQ